MELVRGIHNLKARHKGSVLTIGNFDGVHIGHQAVLSRLVTKARELDLPAVVMIFEPQPREFFTPEQAPARLSRLRDKYIQLNQFGIDRLICISFNRQFAQMSARQFIEELLVEKLGVQHLVIGDDFRFGMQRAGNFDTLKAAGQQWQFDVINTDTYTQSCLSDAVRVSSTLVRTALADDNFELARQLLGREFSISGRVVYGRQLGRTLGIPTANILLKRHNSPLHGVFLVKVEGVENRVFDGVANIGLRPTVQGDNMQLEVHLFDYCGNLYHQHLTVKVIKKLRAEMKFDSLEQLKQQIENDISMAKMYISN